MAKKLSKKKIEQISNQIYNETCMGVQFNIMELGKVTGPAETILANGGTVEEAKAQMIKDREEQRLN